MAVDGADDGRYRYHVPNVRFHRTDAALIAVAAILGGFFLADFVATERPTGTRIVVDLALGIVACTALLLRRRWPTGVAVALIPAILFSSAAIGATAAAMSAVALYRSRRTVAGVVVGHAALLATSFGLAQADSFWEGMLVLLALDAVMIAAGWLVRSERQLQLAAQERIRTIAESQVADAQSAERRRIAREMHDSLAHRLSLLAVYAGALEVRKSATAEDRSAVDIIRRGAIEALDELRDVLIVLRDTDESTDHPQPTLNDIPELIGQSRAAGTRVDVDNDLTRRSVAVSDKLGRHIYRVVQEGLTNARKHAGGNPVRLRLAADDTGTGINVEITNPLATGPTATSSLPGASAGLVGLRERMVLIGGTLDHGTTAAGEFRLAAWLPLRP